ncbi:hypothetical protein J6590_098743 [Homalodisca vitripennis]|nr:hypothetical protein J6590_098743 [Homalodisca vitripennis]
MAVFDNEIERWGEVDVPYLPSHLIGSSNNEINKGEPVVGLKNESPVCKHESREKALRTMTESF